MKDLFFKKLFCIVSVAIVKIDTKTQTFLKLQLVTLINIELKFLEMSNASKKPFSKQLSIQCLLSIRHLSSLQLITHLIDIEKFFFISFINLKVFLDVELILEMVRCTEFFFLMIIRILS